MQALRARRAWNNRKRDTRVKWSDLLCVVFVRTYVRVFCALDNGLSEIVTLKLRIVRCSFVPFDLFMTRIFHTMLIFFPNNNKIGKTIAHNTYTHFKWLFWPLPPPTLLPMPIHYYRILKHVNHLKSMCRAAKFLPTFSIHLFQSSHMALSTVKWIYFIYN